MSISVGYDEGRQLDSKDQQRSKTEVRQIRERKWVLGSSRKKDNGNAVQLYKVTISGTLMSEFILIRNRLI